MRKFGDTRTCQPDSVRARGAGPAASGVGAGLRLDEAEASSGAAALRTRFSGAEAAGRLETRLRRYSPNQFLGLNARMRSISSSRPAHSASVFGPALIRSTTPAIRQ